jgi:hypothetical protein
VYWSERIRVEALNIFMLSKQVQHFCEPPGIRLVVDQVMRWSFSYLVIRVRVTRITKYLVIRMNDDEFGESEFGDKC